MYKQQWEIGAPYDVHCCSVDCDYDSRYEYPLACWTLLNPVDGGDPMYYCELCRYRMENGVWG